MMLKVDDKHTQECPLEYIKCINWTLAFQVGVYRRLLLCHCATKTSF